METQILDYFIHAFTHLHRSAKNGGAPHKPVLLLSIIQQYELGIIKNNRIFINPELTHSFSVHWNQLVTTNHKLNFALPFFHLTGEKGNWWKLVPNLGCELWIDNAGSMRSFGNLSAAVAYAEIDLGLFSLLTNKESREILKSILLKEYFQNQTIENQEDNYLNDLKNELNEPKSQYKNNLQNLKKVLDPETYQIEVYNRGTIFRREIVKLYDETCCMSGLRVSATFTITMVDACHIEQFAKTFNNHPTNGIALCPNLHRAFDRGAISVNDNYEIILSKSIKENIESDYSFHKLDGKSIILPSDSQYNPSLEGFAWHRKNVFKK
ncbi:MAG: HNH endonuclease [Arcicella sp.]|nr:HNH endonuclease [Arcicella sp.]